MRGRVAPPPSAARARPRRWAIELRVRPAAAAARVGAARGRDGRRGGQRLAQRQHLRARIPGRPHHAAHRPQPPLLLQLADLELAREAQHRRGLPPRQEPLVARWRPDGLLSLIARACSPTETLTSDEQSQQFFIRVGHRTLTGGRRARARWTGLARLVACLRALRLWLPAAGHVRPGRRGGDRRAAAVGAAPARPARRAAARPAGGGGAAGRRRRGRRRGGGAGPRRQRTGGAGRPPDAAGSGGRPVGRGRRRSARPPGAAARAAARDAAARGGAAGAARRGGSSGGAARAAGGGGPATRAWWRRACAGSGAWTSAPRAAALLVVGHRLRRALLRDRAWPRSLNNTGAFIFKAVVDGTPRPAFTTTTGTANYNLATGLAAGEHTVELYRQTEGGQGNSQLLSLTVTGGSLSAPPPGPGQPHRGHRRFDQRRLRHARDDRRQRVFRDREPLGLRSRRSPRAPSAPRSAPSARPAAASTGTTAAT